MEVEDKNKNSKLRRARRKVAELKGFYTHLMVYLAINTMIMLIKIVGTAYYGETFMGPIWHFSTYGTWLFWGIGLAFHALKVFSPIPTLGKDWEKRRIQRYIEKEEKEMEKYR